MNSVNVQKCLLDFSNTILVQYYEHIIVTSNFLDISKFALDFKKFMVCIE